MTDLQPNTTYRLLPGARPSSSTDYPRAAAALREELARPEPQVTTESSVNLDWEGDLSVRLSNGIATFVLPKYLAPLDANVPVDPAAAAEETLDGFRRRITEALHAKAREHGWCAEFDEFCRAQGLPARGELLPAEVGVVCGFYDSDDNLVWVGRRTGTGDGEVWTCRDARDQYDETDYTRSDSELADYRCVVLFPAG